MLKNENANKSKKKITILLISGFIVIAILAIAIYCTVTIINRNNKYSEFSVGYWDNDTYYNDFFDIGFTLPDEWTKKSDSEISSYNTDMNGEKIDLKDKGGYLFYSGSKNDKYCVYAFVSIYSEPLFHTNTANEYMEKSEQELKTVCKEQNANYLRNESDDVVLGDDNTLKCLSYSISYVKDGEGIVNNSTVLYKAVGKYCLEIIINNGDIPYDELVKYISDAEHK